MRIQDVVGTKCEDPVLGPTFYYRSCQRAPLMCYFFQPSGGSVADAVEHLEHLMLLLPSLSGEDPNSKAERELVVPPLCHKRSLPVSL